MLDASQYNRGWHRGNYASAYETEDVQIGLETVRAAQEFQSLSVESRIAYVAGFVNGFFSSYDWPEVPRTARALRSACGRYAQAAGLDRLETGMPGVLDRLSGRKAREIVARAAEIKRPQS